MNRLTALISTLALACILSACNTSPANTADDIKAIQSLEDQQNQDFNSKDGSKVVSHYADDAIMITPGGPSVTGKQAIMEANKGMLSDPAFSLHFHADTIKVAKSGDLAYTQGAYVLTFTEPSVHKVITDKGSYVTTYGKQADGSWKILTDIVTSQTPMGPPPQG